MVPRTAIEEVASPVVDVLHRDHRCGAERAGRRRSSPASSPRSATRCACACSPSSPAEGEVCSCNLEGPLGKSQPTVSHHTRVLAEAGLIEGEKRGRWTWWRVVPNADGAPAGPARGLRACRAGPRGCSAHRSPRRGRGPRPTSPRPHGGRRGSPPANERTSSRRRGRPRRGDVGHDALHAALRPREPPARRRRLGRGVARRPGLRARQGLPGRRALPPPDRAGLRRPGAPDGHSGQPERGGRPVRVTCTTRASSAPTPACGSTRRGSARTSTPTGPTSSACCASNREPSGGESRIASSATVYNRILAERPDLLEVLYQPMCWDRNDEEPEGEDPTSPCPSSPTSAARLGSSSSAGTSGTPNGTPGAPPHGRAGRGDRARRAHRQRRVRLPRDGVPARRHPMVGQRPHPAQPRVLRGRPRSRRRRHLLRLWLAARTSPTSTTCCEEASRPGRQLGADMTASDTESDPRSGAGALRPGGQRSRVLSWDRGRGRGSDRTDTLR